MLAASTALAWPCVTPSARCCRLPTPPEAMTGMGTASETARSSGSANILVFRDGQVAADSADGFGLLWALETRGGVQ